ncbi:hypothetical protein [Bradyrhizobium sp. LB11.1]|uniref:hypothetical protein n=1 Tax=Bradyrhizobium sp. LB11.1 TaxID=3156326 RepID=UPI003394FF22
MKQYKSHTKTSTNTELSTNVFSLPSDVTAAELGKLVAHSSGNVGVFLGWEKFDSVHHSADQLTKLARVERGGRHEACLLIGGLSSPSTIDDLARVYRSSIEFYDHSAQRDERLDSETEDLIQRARPDAYDLARSCVQRIRDLNEPDHIDSIAACLDFMEREGESARAIKRQRAALAAARERRRVAMGFEPFCAETYFRRAHEFGDEPSVYANDDGSIGIGWYLYGEKNDEANRNRDWAFYEDPDMDLQAAYARSVLAAQPASDGRRVLLGV